MAKITDADLLIVHANELITCAGFSDRPARGNDLGAAGIIHDGAVAIAHGKIAAVGSTSDILSQYEVDHHRVIDATGSTVLPGFVDCHTHMVFAGDRADEWEARMQGKSYLEILRDGGGIQRTVQATRAAGKEQLLTDARRWAERFLKLGTTTAEIKSGYGLNHDSELKILEVARAIGDELPLKIITTFLGAHVVPTDAAHDRKAYLDLVENLAVEIWAQGLARFFDVFCESEAFTVEETRRLLEFGRKLGYGLKLHAEQFTSMGGAALGAELGAISVDHLDAISHDDLVHIAAMDEPPIGVLLPGVTFHLKLDDYAPARKIIDARLPVALATDFNPGSANTPSMPMMIALATRHMGMGVAEAIMASTINGAHALGVAEKVGSIEPGKAADIIICGVDNHRWLGYSFGWNPVEKVIVDGQVL